MLQDVNIGQTPGQQFYSRVKIKGQDISSSNIQSLTIREWVVSILPKLELSVFDLGNIIETLTLEDGDEIEVILAKDQSSEIKLNMKFAFSDYSIDILNDNRMQVINIVGYLKCDNMFYLQNRSFSGKRSDEVFKQIASECGLGFVNRYSINTNDKMNWFQLNKNNFEFLKHVLKRSYLYDDVIMLYADSNSKLIMTSLNREITKKDNIVAKFDVEKYEYNADITDKNIYFNSYDVVNMSGYFNKINNYGVTAQYYDMLNPISIQYNKFKKMSDLSFINKKYNGKLAYNLNWGMYNNLNIYSEKYYESLIRNEFLISNFFGYSVMLQINADNDVKLFDKLNVVIPSILSGELNEVLSGMYLVGGIIHNISNGNIYRKMVSVHRNGNNKSSNITESNLA